MKNLYIGIDIGGTNTIVGFITSNGNFLSEHRISTKGHKSFDDFLLQIKNLITEKFEPYINEYQLIAIGAGAPNGNYYKGTIEDAPNLEWKGKLEFSRKFSDLMQLPVVLTNDANAAAIGEMLFGNAKGMKNFIMITLGTGLGSGLVANGELIYGHDGFAGELGHTIVNSQGRYCGCGRRGCLETYVSATGIKRTVYKMLADRLEESVLRAIPFDGLTAKNITEAAQAGDKVAILSFEYTGQILGEKLADAVAHTSPEAIFLFGGLAKAGKYIFEPTIRHFEQSLLPIYRNKIKILPSGLMDQNVAVLGAASLAIKEFSI
jgi:glucokinase